MRKQILFLVIPVLLVLAVLLGSGRSLAQGPDASQPQASVGQGFTYQGQLKDGSGNPITNSCDFRFSLWDALSAGSQVGGDSTVTGVSVANGYFAALVDAVGEFGANAFTGDARWLEIAVQCSGDAGYTTLSPRQELTTAPYALSLRPGAQVVGAVSGAAAILGQNTAANGIGLYGVGPNAVVGDSSSPNYAAIVGRNYAGSGAGYGVYGLSASADPGTAGLYGWANAASGQTYGAYGQSDSPDGTGIYGYASATSGAPSGVVGRTAAPGETGVFTYYSMGVWGYATSTSGPTAGVWGQSASTEGIGVRGWASANSGTTYGVYGLADSAGGIGVHGVGNTGVSGQSATGTGVAGSTSSTAAIGVYGYASASAGTTYGMYGQAASTDGTGVYGIASATSGWAWGVKARSNSTGGGGVYGYASATSGANYGVYGHTDSTDGRGVQGVAMAYSGTTYGVYGQSNSSNGYGVYGLANNDSGTTYGVYGAAVSADGYGVYGFGLSGYAGYFHGNVHIEGTLSKTAGSFKIDDPLDPANKYLYHSFVESPDMMNIYNGNVTLDGNGEAWVQMPDWFEALNGSSPSDYRYQLTCVGGFAPVYIAQKIQDNRFKIAGGTAGLEVSWQVTGIRHDPYAEAHRIPVEQDKPAGEKGTYLYPGLYGQPESLGLDYQRNPDQCPEQP